MDHPPYFDWSKIEKILCLGAHADDIEIGAGGTLLRLLAGPVRREIVWVVFSGDGERRQEAVESAQRYLANASSQGVITHDFPDRYFPGSVASIKQAMDAIRHQFSPDVVFTHRLEDRHQDHRCLAECTWNTFRDQLILEYEIPKYEGDLGQPNFFVSLTRELCEQKIRWLHEAFPSQADKDWFDAETFWGLLRLRGLEARSSTRYAEAFTARKLVG